MVGKNEDYFRLAPSRIKTEHTTRADAVEENNNSELNTRVFLRLVISYSHQLHQ